MTRRGFTVLEITAVLILFSAMAAVSVRLMGVSIHAAEHAAVQQQDLDRLGDGLTRLRRDVFSAEEVSLEGSTLTIDHKIRWTATTGSSGAGTSMTGSARVGTNGAGTVAAGTGSAGATTTGTTGTGIIAAGRLVREESGSRTIWSNVQVGLKLVPAGVEISPSDGVGEPITLIVAKRWLNTVSIAPASQPAPTTGATP